MSGRLDEDRKSTSSSSPHKKMSLSAYLEEKRHGSDWRDQKDMNGFKEQSKQSHVIVTNLLEGEDLEDGELTEAHTGENRRSLPKTPDHPGYPRRRQNSPGNAYTPPHEDGSPRRHHSPEQYSQLRPPTDQLPHSHGRSRSPPRGPPPHKSRRSRSHSRGPPPGPRGTKGPSRGSRSRSRSRSTIHSSRGPSPHSSHNGGPPPPGFGGRPSSGSPGRGRSRSRSRGPAHGGPPRSPRAGSRGVSPHNGRPLYPPRGGDGFQGQLRGRSWSPRGRPGSPRGRPGSPRGGPGSPRGRPGSPRGRPGSPRGRPGSPRGRPRGRPGSPRSGPSMPLPPRGRFNDGRALSPPRSPTGGFRRSRSPRRPVSPRHDRAGRPPYRFDGPSVSPRFHPGSRPSSPRDRFSSGGPGSPRTGRFGSPRGFPGGSPRGPPPPRPGSSPRFNRHSPPRSPGRHCSPPRSFRERSRSPGGRPLLRRTGSPPPAHHRSMSRGRSRSRSHIRSLGPNGKRERSWERHGPPPPVRGSPSLPPPTTQMFTPSPKDWVFELQKSGKFCCRCRGIAASLPVHLELPSVFNIVQLPQLSKFEEFLLMNRRDVKRSVYEILPDGPADRGGYAQLRDYLLRGKSGIPRAGVACEVEHHGYKVFIIPPGQVARVLGYMADQMILVFRQRV